MIYYFTSFIVCIYQVHLHYCGVTSAVLWTFAFHHLNHSTHYPYLTLHLASRLVKMTSRASLSTGLHLDCVASLTSGHLIRTQRWCLTATGTHMIFVVLVSLISILLWCFCILFRFCFTFTEHMEPLLFSEDATQKNVSVSASSVYSSRDILDINIRSATFPTWSEIFRTNSRYNQWLQV